MNLDVEPQNEKPDVREELIQTHNNIPQPLSYQESKLHVEEEDQEKTSYVLKSRKRKRLKKQIPPDKTCILPNRRLYTPPAVKFQINRNPNEAPPPILYKSKRKPGNLITVKPTDCQGRNKKEATSRYYGASSLHLASNSLQVENSTIQVGQGFPSTGSLKKSSKTSGLTADIPASFKNQTTLSAKEIIDSLTSQIREYKLSELKIIEELKTEKRDIIACTKKSPRDNSKTSVDSNNNKKIIKKSPTTFRRQPSSLSKPEDKRILPKKSEKLIKGSVRSKSLVRTSVSNIVQEVSQFGIVTTQREPSKYLPTIITRSLSNVNSQIIQESDCKNYDCKDNTDKGKLLLEIRIPSVTCDNDIGLDSSSSTVNIHKENNKEKKKVNEVKKVNRIKQKNRGGRCTFDYNDVLKTDIAKKTKDVKSGSGGNNKAQNNTNNSSNNNNIHNYPHRATIRHICEHSRKGNQDNPGHCCIYCNIKQNKH